MPHLSVLVTTKRMPISTQFQRSSKGVEHFYYALLFATAKAYHNQAEPWQSWRKQGFHVSIREAPPSARDTDRVVLTRASEGKMFRVTLSGGDRETMKRLVAVLRRVDSLRPSLNGRDPDARASAALADKEVRQSLMDPLNTSLSGAGLSQSDIADYMSMVRRALIAMTDDEVLTIRVALE